MEQYKNLGGNSNVSSYETGNDHIKVRFKDGMIYLYNNSSAGSHNIETMKRLAMHGRGLNSFIKTDVNKMYASKSRC
jgi:hypothetical protein